MTWTLRILTVSALVGAGLALAQPSTVEDLVHALRSDALAEEEPLGAAIACDPYLAVLPEVRLGCFELHLPDRVVRGRFQAYVSGEEAFSWVEEEWVEIADLPDHVDPGDTHLRRTIASTSGATFTIAVFDQGIASHVVVGSGSD